MALISLVVVAVVSSMVPLAGAFVPLVWLLSGPLVFNSRVEAVIARHLLGMRRPEPADAQRLAEVWGEVTRRAGVRPDTYELWIQERAELNATAAAGHIVGVTRHAMDRLPNSQLAAVLAHELGHHVGGHTWAGLLVDWYALPARTAGRLIAVVLSKTLKAKPACGGCLLVMVVWFVAFLSFFQGLWWLVLSVAVAPLMISWLHRRAESRADDYAAGLGFGAELKAVLRQELQSRPAPAPGSVARTHGWPPHPGAPYSPQAPWPPAPPQTPGWPPHPANSPFAAKPAKPDPAQVLARAAHRNVEARLKHLGRSEREPREPMGR
ncbi:M48 family metalloprotease [Kitasatospora acidiphila]|uniref:M48 family metalloprotease n=2 Tax=Kitasatospora acidiphila TaxID=2567942 RepID=A0A540W6N9_9ACTN|nr:M48 family metalloprotease [Kitasatospora acidiphila]